MADTKDREPFTLPEPDVQVFGGFEREGGPLPGEDAAQRAASLREALESESERAIRGLALRKDFMGDGIWLTQDVVADSLPEYFEDPMITASHDLRVREIVGRADEEGTRVVDEGLLTRGIISQSEDGLWTKILEGILRSFSVGFSIIGEPHYEEELDVHRPKKIRLWEIALAGIPADRGARFQVARGLTWGNGRRGYEPPARRVVYARSMPRLPVGDLLRLGGNWF